MKLVEKVKVESLVEASIKLLVMRVAGAALFEVVEEAIFVKLVVAEKVIVSLEVLIRDEVIVVLGEE